MRKVSWGKLRRLRAPATKSNKYINTLQAALRAAFCVLPGGSTIGQQTDEFRVRFQWDSSHAGSETRERRRRAEVKRISSPWSCCGRLGKMELCEFLS